MPERPLQPLTQRCCLSGVHVRKTGRKNLSPEAFGRFFSYPLLHPLEASTPTNPTRLLITPSLINKKQATAVTWLSLGAHCPGHRGPNPACRERTGPVILKKKIAFLVVNITKAWIEGSNRACGGRGRNYPEGRDAMRKARWIRPSKVISHRKRKLCL